MHTTEQALLAAAEQPQPRGDERFSRLPAAYSFSKVNTTRAGSAANSKHQKQKWALANFQRSLANQEANLNGLGPICRLPVNLDALTEKPQ